MTRTVRDSARLMAVLSQPDPRDGMSLPDAEIPWLDLDACEIRGLRIGLMMDAGVGLPVEPAVAEAVREAAETLARLGAVVRPVEPIMSRALLDGLDDFWRARSWDDISRLSPDQRAKVLPYIVAWAEKGADLSGVAVIRGFNRTMEMRAAAARLFRELDFVLSPTAPVVAFPAELAGPTADPQKPFEHIGFTVAWNMTEQPAASINCGFTEAGLPIGLQIVGRRFDDLGVLRLAQLYENVREVRTSWPEPPAA
jgi:aspartyl-tRNA(Asn)/glutamyl-tRNA(Gln) amidotransferase subunit A